MEIQFCANFCNLLIKKTQKNTGKTFCGVDLLCKHTVSKCIYPSYFFIVLYLATYTAFFSHIHGGSSACWGERTWEKWRKFSRSVNQSFYVNCEDSDSYYEGTSPLKSQNNFKGQLHRSSSSTSQHLDYVIVYVISQPLIVNFVLTCWEKWRKFSWSVNKSFYVNCKDSDSYYEGTSPLKLQNNSKGQLNRISSGTIQHIDYVIKYVFFQPLIQNFVATFLGENTWEKGWNLFRSVKQSQL